MRAVRIHRYGGPEVLQVDDVEKPRPGPRDVLIKVFASSVNPVDWKIRTGGQRNVIRYELPWILGLDASGVVEEVGAEVKRFKAGDEVWSSPRHTRPGCYAEYTVIDEREVAKKPKNLTHEQAASMPLVGLTAYQCIVEKGRLEKGQRVLIHAGAGGVGSFAIQLAHHLGAHVITTASERNADFVKQLGADQVVDYKKESFARAAAPVDLVLDSLGESAFDENLAVVRPGGRISNITFDVPRHVEKYGPNLSLLTLAGAMVRFHAWPLIKKGVKARHVIKRCDGEQLQEITALVESGAIAPVVGEVIPLEEIRRAHERSESHHARGKIVIRVATEG